LLFQLLLHFEEFLRFFLLHAVQRHPGPLGHDVHDIVARDDDFALIALFPPWILWLPNAIWKSFDLFVGAIQAFIFALLTILYFSQSMELDEDHH